MAITYPGLRRNEREFHYLSGVSVAEFDGLYQRFEPQWRAAEHKRLESRERQRVQGGGGDYRLDLDTRLLLCMVWMRHYLTTGAVGSLFGVSQSTASRTITRLLPVLHKVAQASFNPPKEPGARRTHLPPKAVDDFAIVDASEQSVNRPQDAEQERLHFSGRQKRPTCKMTLCVNEDGLVRHLSASAPGAIADITQLRHSGILAQIARDTIAVGDAGYAGLQDDLPHHSVAVAHKPERDHPLLPDHRLANRELSSIRIKVENVLAQLKNFRILSHRFRHNVAIIHSQVVCILASLHNWRTLRRLRQAYLRG
jgi:hypothetical protein